MEPLLFIIIALILGTLTRHILKKSPVHYTLLLLIIGLILGIVARMNFLSPLFDSFVHSVKWAGNIDPHLVLFVFLPTLVFEAPFGMDWHIFKKSAVNATLLAAAGYYYCANAYWSFTHCS